MKEQDFAPWGVSAGKRITFTFRTLLITNLAKFSLLGIGARPNQPGFWYYGICSGCTTIVCYDAQMVLGGKRGAIGKLQGHLGEAGEFYFI